MTEVDESGFTLIEVIVALALFALIALAGVTLLGSVMRVQRGTQGRLERLGDEQRALFVIADDFSAMANVPLTANATGIDFARRTSTGPRAMHYQLRDGVLERTLDHGALTQQVLDGVAGLHWQFYVRGKGWVERWPPVTNQAQEWPAAIAVDLELAGPMDAASRSSGESAAYALRRVVVLPLRPALSPPRLVLPGQRSLPGQGVAGQPSGSTAVTVG